MKNNEFRVIYNPKPHHGTIIFLCNKEVNLDAIDAFTESCFYNKYCENDPSIYNSDIAGLLEDEVMYEDLISSIKEGTSPEEKLILLFKEINNRAKLFVIIEEDKFVSQLDHHQSMKKYIKKFGEDLLIFVREYEPEENDDFDEDE